ncbi:MAG: hypothetical protein K2G32_07065, partial [Oscillospiraceae bacterium]|nr:hypothetical protein [Oscillospiraceae bacterium]
FSRDQWNLPDEWETVLLKTAVWTGKTALKKDTCYFVNKKIRLSRSVTLPEGSMLVIRSALIVGKGGSLTVNGAVVVQSGAMLNAYDGGKVVIKESGAAVVNGKLAVSKNGSVSSSGYIQGGDSAQINVKGTLSLSGELVSLVKPKIYSYAAVEGGDKIEVIDGNTRQRYYVEELSQYSGAMTCEYMGEEFEISDTKLKQRIVDNIESVLYQYSGEISVPEFQRDHLEEYSTELGDSNSPIFYIENVNGGFLSPWKFKAMYTSHDTIEGCFYSRIVGKDDPDIRAELGELRQSAMNS